MSTRSLSIWSCIVHSREVSAHSFDDLAMSGLAYSVAASYIFNSCPFSRLERGLDMFYDAREDAVNWLGK